MFAPRPPPHASLPRPPGAQHKGPVVGQQPRQQASLWVTHYLAISFVWLADSLLEARVWLLGWGRGCWRPLSSVTSPEGDGFGTSMPFMWQWGSQYAMQAEVLTKTAAGAGTARCLQPRQGKNQSPRRGRGMWSPSGVPLLPIL